MQFTIYSSSDASAPVLTGTAGDLVALLDAILRTGYGTKAAAGWTKPYIGTNKAAFRMGSGNQRYLRVQDDAPGAGGAKEARITGYDSMSDVDTGTNPFPTAAQGLGGTVAALAVRKSTSADTLARSWLAFATTRHLYLFIQPGDTAGAWIGHYFGDFYSHHLTGTGNTLIVARATENSGAANLDVIADTRAPGTNVSAHFAAHALDGSGSSTQIGKHCGANGAGGAVGTASLASVGFHGELYLDPVYTHVGASAATAVRTGRMPGMWGMPYAYNFTAHGAVWKGAGALAGKTFYYISPTGNSVQNTFTMGLVLEISDTLLIN